MGGGAGRQELWPPSASVYPTNTGLRAAESSEEGKREKKKKCLPSVKEIWVKKPVEDWGKRSPNLFMEIFLPLLLLLSPAVTFGNVRTVRASWASSVSAFFYFYFFSAGEEFGDVFCTSASFQVSEIVLLQKRVRGGYKNKQTRHFVEHGGGHEGSSEGKNNKLEWMNGACNGCSPPVSLPREFSETSPLLRCVHSRCKHPCASLRLAVVKWASVTGRSARRSGNYMSVSPS